jgi:hypothetical protein
MILKLWLVTLQGPFSYVSGNDPCRHYVIAEDPTAAYSKVREWMDRKDLGFFKSREMKSVEQIATCGEYGSPIRLWV